MKNYDNLNKIHDAIIDWDEFFSLQYKSFNPEIHIVAQPNLKEGEWFIWDDNNKIVHMNGRNYLVTAAGYLWPVEIGELK